jgi:pSer/pThr/pTyr-binding forkhead associated (FHA) protein
MDLNSTNGTFLNEEELTAGQWYKLSEKDIVKFACSTREYHVKCG